MITESEKLQSAVSRTQSNLDRLKVELGQASQAVMDDPNNEAAALRATRLEMQVKAAENAHNSANQALTKYQEYMKSPEAKADLKRLDKMNKELEKAVDEIVKDAMALGDKFETLEESFKEAKTLARKYDQQPFNWEAGGVLRLRNDILRWFRMRKSLRRHEEIMAMPNHGLITVNQPDTKEHKRMIKERYPKPGER